MTADSEISTDFRIPKRCQRFTFALSGPGFALVIKPKSHQSVQLRQFIADTPPPKPLHSDDANRVVLAWLELSVDHLKTLCQKPQ